MITKKGAKERVEVVYGVTSLSAERASAVQLLAWVRGHWHIENQSHWVRDVTSEDSHSPLMKIVLKFAVAPLHR